MYVTLINGRTAELTITRSSTVRELSPTIYEEGDIAVDLPDGRTLAWQDLPHPSELADIFAELMRAVADCTSMIAAASATTGAATVSPELYALLDAATATAATLRAHGPPEVSLAQMERTVRHLASDGHVGAPVLLAMVGLARAAVAVSR